MKHNYSLLTDAYLKKQFKPHEGNGSILVRDKELKGFGIRLSSSKASWFTEYGVPHQQTRRKIFGHWPDIPADEAREIAYTYRGRNITHSRWRTIVLAELEPGRMQSRQNIEHGLEMAEGAVTSLQQHSTKLIDFDKANDLDALAKELENIQ